MTLSRRRFLHAASAIAATGLVPRPAGADAYPDRPVRMIVPFGPGGQTDVTARIIAQKLSDQLARQFFVENMPGAGGTIGMGKVAQAAPDGYTLLVTDATSFVVNPGLFKKVAYHPEKDFSPITLAASTSQVLVVHPSLPVNSVKELVDLVKSNPGKYSYASVGFGSPSHLTAELFRTSLGLELIHVPFGGAGPAVNSTLGGHTPIAFGSPASLVEHVKSGSLRGLAVAAQRRLNGAPMLQTMAEAGYPQVECEAWMAVLAPTGTSREIVDLLNRDINALIVDPDVKERLAALGFEPANNTPESSAKMIKAESEKWSRVIADAGIRPQ